MSEQLAIETERPGFLGGLRLVGHELRYEQLSFWLNRVGAVFTVGFSVVFLVLLGSSAGNSRISYLGNIKLIQYYVPGFVAYGVMAACFTTLAITIVVTKRDRALKTHPAEPTSDVCPSPLDLLEHHDRGGRAGDPFTAHRPVRLCGAIPQVLAGTARRSHYRHRELLFDGSCDEHCHPEPGERRPGDEHRFLRAPIPVGAVVSAQGRLRTCQILQLLPGPPLPSGRFRSVPV